MNNRSNPVKAGVKPCWLFPGPPWSLLAHTRAAPQRRRVDPNPSLLTTVCIADVCQGHHQAVPGVPHNSDKTHGGLYRSTRHGISWVSTTVKTSTSTSIRSRNVACRGAPCVSDTRRARARALSSMHAGRHIPTPLIEADPGISKIQGPTLN